MQNYIVTEDKAIAVINEDGSTTTYGGGEVVALDPEAKTTIAFLQGGLIAATDLEVTAKNVEVDVKVNAAPKGEDKVMPTSTAVKTYRGQKIIDEKPRTVGAQTFQEVTLEDGSRSDLTEEEYKKEVVISQ